MLRNPLKCNRKYSFCQILLVIGKIWWKWIHYAQIFVSIWIVLCLRRAYLEKYTICASLKPPPPVYTVGHRKWRKHHKLSVLFIITLFLVIMKRTDSVCIGHFVSLQLFVGLLFAVADWWTNNSARRVATGHRLVYGFCTRPAYMH